MKVSDTKDSRRAAWAISLSVLVHLLVIGAYVGLPWLRTLLLFVDMQKPQVKLDMGMPQFVEVMIEELKNAKPAAPQPPPEPEKEIEKPKESPTAVVVKPKNPDTYTEPVTPKSQPASVPTSEPSTLATSQPATEPTSLATTEPASKPTKAGGVPLVATGLVDSMPAGSKWLVLLGTEQMRKSPRRDVLGYSMRNHVFTNGEPIDKIGLDALEDVDEVMLVTEDPWNTKNAFGFVLRFRGTQADIKKRMEETAEKNGTKLISTKNADGKEIFQWESEAKKPPYSHYAFAFLSSNTMVIAVPPVMQHFFDKQTANNNKLEKSQPTSAPASEPAAPPKFLSGVMTERGEAPAILFAVSDLGETFPMRTLVGVDWGENLNIFIKLPPQPLYFRAAFEAKEAASASFDAAFLTEKDAQDAASSVNAVLPLVVAYISTQKPFDLLAPVAKRIKFKVYGKTIRADVDLTQEEVETLLEGFEPIIKGGPIEDDSHPPQPAKPPSKSTNPTTNNQPASQPL